MILRTVLVTMLAGCASAAGASPALDACLAGAHATRQAQHCQAVEIARLDAAVDAAVARRAAARPRDGPEVRRRQARWAAETDGRCGAIGRATHGSLASIEAQACFIAADTARLAALGR